MYIVRFLIISLLFLASCVARTKTVPEGVEKQTKPLTFMDKIKGKTKADIVFATPYGEVTKGASMPEVMNFLGNPYHITFDKNTEIWHYNFGSNKELFVYFVNGSVTDIKDNQNNKSLE